MHTCLHNVPCCPALTNLLQRREVPALRTLCNRLEEAVLLCLVNVSYKDLWEPVDRAAFPQYYAVIARPMDLSTLRRNILNREYVTYNMFDKDLQLLHSNAVQFNGEHHSIARCAKKAVQVTRSFLAEERKQRERDARDCSVQYKIACARAPEVLKWLRLGFGLPQEAVAATASATVEASALLPAATSANAVFSTPSSMAAGAPLPHVQPTVLQGGVGMGEEEEEEEVVMTSHAVPFAAQALTPAPNAVVERSDHGEGMEEDEEEIVLGGGGGVPAVATAHPMLDEDEEEEEIVLTEQQVRLPTSHTSGAVSVTAGGHQDDGVGDDGEEEEIVLTHGNV
ncbi:hypothetical protein EON66_00165 [archaeon]|nr:MAG: hypothetical protein EON66_00165 [archaeon]